MIDCLRCGKCCHWLDDKGNTIKCRYLIKLSNSVYHCRIYHNRLGKIIGVINGNDVKCINRVDSRFDYLGCPFNDGVKPMLDIKVR